MSALRKTKFYDHYHYEISPDDRESLTTLIAKITGKRLSGRFTAHLIQGGVNGVELVTAVGEETPTQAYASHMLDIENIKALSEKRTRS